LTLPDSKDEIPRYACLHLSADRQGQARNDNIIMEYKYQIFLIKSIRDDTILRGFGGHPGI
jgi:hypothetical protein